MLKMKKYITPIFRTTFIGLLTVIVTLGCKEEPSKPVKKAEAIIAATNSETPVTGTLSFVQNGDGPVKLELEITVPSRSNQSVAVHIHEHGDCGEGGNMTHGHWNPTSATHGKWGSSAFHAGDIGNIALDAAGKGKLTLETNLWSIDGDNAKNILNRGIIVHGGIDDYATQPTGNSGPRIGCGVIIKKN
ncbi:Superoxide dismutase-like protein YojM precursor [compost metagenome]